MQRIATDCNGSQHLQLLLRYAIREAVKLQLTGLSGFEAARIRNCFDDQVGSSKCPAAL